MRTEKSKTKPEKVKQSRPTGKWPPFQTDWLNDLVCLVWLMMTMSTFVG